MAGWVGTPTLLEGLGGGRALTLARACSRMLSRMHWRSMWGGGKGGVRLDWDESTRMFSQRTIPGICCPISDAPRQLKHSVSSLRLMAIQSREQGILRLKELANS